MDCQIYRAIIFICGIYIIMNDVKFMYKRKGSCQNKTIIVLSILINLLISYHSYTTCNIWFLTFHIGIYIISMLSFERERMKCYEEKVK